MKPHHFRYAFAGLAGFALLAGATAPRANEVNVYSYRQPELVKPLYDAFTEKTGIKVNVLFAQKGLVERLEAEGRNSPADLIFTVDIGRLMDVTVAGLTQPVDSDVLNEKIPSQYRDSDGNWFALTTRTRIVYASKDRVDPSEITSYEDLADPKWKGRICTRSGSHPYTVALVAAQIERHGEEKAKAWLAGVKDNLARKPTGNDRAQVKAIAAGECDISLGNNYYYGKMLEKDDQRPWAEAVNIVFPGQGEGGTGAHVNISGVAMAKHAPNPENALKLMEYLASSEAQSMYAEMNYEYPVTPGVAWSPVVESWGRFEADTMPIEDIAAHRADALRLVNEVAFDDGPSS